MKSIKEYIAVITFFLLLVIAVFVEVYNGQKVFVSGDTLSPVAIKYAFKNFYSINHYYPLWTPWIFSGMPTIHSFLNVSANYYPHSIMIFLNNLGLPWMWNFLFHFILSGFGMYVLLKYLKQSKHAAIFGSIGYMIMPYMVVMTAYGHGSQIMTASYIPLILLYLIKSLNHKSLSNY